MGRNASIIYQVLVTLANAFVHTRCATWKALKMWPHCAQQPMYQKLKNCWFPMMSVIEGPTVYFEGLWSYYVWCMIEAILAGTIIQPDPKDLNSTTLCSASCIEEMNHMPCS